MANYCDFDIKVIGQKEAVDTFLQLLTEENYSKAHLGYRIFDAFCSESEYTDDGNYSMFIHGYCAWSAHSCMFDDEHTYIGDRKGEDSSVIDIVESTKILGLKLEMFTAEPGLAFSEHYIIDNGEILVDSCVDYYEEYLENEWGLELSKIVCEHIEDCGEFLWKWEI